MNLWYVIVDLLPFEWAEPGKMLFMKNALLAILVISPLFGLLSTMVVEKKMSFFSDALGHSAFTGIAAGTLAGFADPSWCAVALAICFALLFTWVSERTNLASDTIIGVFSSTAVALGIFLSTIGGRSFTKFNTFLVGDILSVTPGKISLLAIILLLIFLLWLGSINQLTLSAIHPALARSRGVRTALMETLFVCMVAVAVMLSIRWVGVLLINALLILPAAAARNVTRSAAQHALWSVVFGLVSGVAGLAISYALNTGVGAAVVLCAGLIYFVTLLIRRLTVK